MASVEDKGTANDSSEAESHYIDGLYRNAEIVALQAAEEAASAEKPEENNLLFIGIGLVVITGVLWFIRDKFGL